MREFFRPVGRDVPTWLTRLLGDIKAALKDPFDWPIRLWKVPTASLPTFSEAEHEGAIAYDSTLDRLTYGNHTAWVTLQPYGDDLAAIEALSTTGVLVRTGTNTWALRTITGTANEITLTNGDGVSGNPTVSIPTSVTFTGKTITGGTYASPTISGTANVSGVTFSNACSFSGTVTFNNATATATSISGNRSLSSWGQAGPNLRVVANTLTNTSTAEAGTVALEAANSLAQPTLASSNNITVTNAANLYIDDAPLAGTGTTIGTSWALYIAAGGARVGGAFTVTGNATIGDNVSDAHSITGNVTITESTGPGLILKDSAGNGTAADVHIEFQGADAVVKGSIGPSSSATSNIDVNSASGDVRILTSNTLQATFDGDGLNLVSGNWYEVNGTQVLKARITGWTADTGTAARGANATYSGTAEATYTQATIQTLMDAVKNLSQNYKAMKDDLISHGMIGA